MATVTIDDLSINYLRHPASGAGGGQRIIYIHGTGCNGRVFERHMAALPQQHDAVAIDLPGHGGSEGRGFRGVGDYAYFTMAVVQALGWDSCVVAGHSLGGGIALATALYFPGVVSGLLLIDTGARLRVDPLIITYARRLAAGEQQPVDSRLGYADATPQAIIDDVNALTAGCDPRVTYRDWIANDTCDFMSRLPHISAPALAICGADDPLTPPKYHEYLTDHLPECTLEVIPDAGHWPFAEQPTAFDASVHAFLATLTSA